MHDLCRLYGRLDGCNQGTDSTELLSYLGVGQAFKRPKKNMMANKRCSSPEGRPWVFSFDLPFEEAVLENIDVVCATCIGCGMGPLDSRTFPFIVIDEAAQAPG